jgi:hypothetical protein
LERRAEVRCGLGFLLYFPGAGGYLAARRAGARSIRQPKGFRIAMKFVIEPEGGRLHWIVKCMDKGKLVELHRFYRALDQFVYHRGNHGQHELDAQKALLQYFKDHPDATAGLPGLRPAEHSTMHVRQIAAGGAKRESKEE